MKLFGYKYEFRSAEIKDSKNSDKQYLVVHLEDEDGKCYSLMTWDLHFCDSFKKGQLYDVVVRLEFGKFLQYHLLEMVPSDAANLA